MLVDAENRTPPSSRGNQRQSATVRPPCAIAVVCALPYKSHVVGCRPDLKVHTQASDKTVILERLIRKPAKMMLVMGPALLAAHPRPDGQAAYLKAK